MKLTQFTFLSLAFVLSGTAFGQSNLPACQGRDVSRWSNCNGEETLSGHSQYKGEFLNGKRHGFGVMNVLHPDFKGDKYVGEFKDGTFHGGTYYFLANNEFKGDKYVGEYKDGKKNGQGTSTFANGNKYVGEYKDSKRNGQGTFTFANGDKHVGEYKDGKPNGQGIETYANGDKYVGEYKDGKKNGQGTFTFANGSKYVGEYKDNKYNGQGTYTFASGHKYVGEWKDGKYNGQGILTTADGKRQEGIWEDNRFIREAKVNLPRLDTNTANNTERSNLERESQQLADERRRLELEKQQREQERISSRIAITATATQPDVNGEFVLSIQTSADTASLQIDGEEQGGKKDGKYSIRRVARVGEQNVYTISARDIYGNTDTKTITVARQVADSRPVPLRLNPLNIKVQQPRDAVAIIIGIEKYKRVPKADFANLDAKDFYNYAVRGLGIRPENIKLLLDEEAGDIEIVKAFENWLPLQVKKDKTDVYVFYSGHGLPSTDGQSLYFLPYGVDKQYLARTAVGQKEVVAALVASKPKSVTMFIDSCYSGQTRGGDVLVASVKPIALKAETNSFPSNFTVITASSNDQLSSSSPELKHGIFSFFLMKGMEGDADSNKDGKITTGEMQEYLSDKVSRQALSMSRKQDTQLIGNPERVLMTVGK
jgi:hypothetical protein